MNLSDPAATAAACVALAERDPDLARALSEAGPLGPPALRPAGFIGLLRIILDQQVSAAAGLAMWTRLLDRLPQATPGSFLALSDEDLRACGFSRQKAAYARGLAEALAEGRLDLDAVHGTDDEAAIAELMRLKGLGRWSGEVYLLLHLGRPDLWPADDLALAIGIQRLKGLPGRPGRRAMYDLAAGWSPWRSTAARLIWHWYAWARRSAAPASRAAT